VGASAVLDAVVRSTKPALQVEVIWFVTPFSVMVGYRRFGGPCCLYLQGQNGDSKAAGE